MVGDEDYDFTKDGIIHFIRKHPKLQAITLVRSSIPIDRATYTEIADICKNQNRILTMKWSSYVFEQNDMDMFDESDDDEDNYLAKELAVLAEGINFDSN